MIEKHVVSRDDSIYEAWPDVTLTPSGRMVCVFSECTHHNDRSYTRIVLTDSTDRGRTWSPKRPLTEGTHDPTNYWNTARISRLPDGRLVAAADRLLAPEDDAALKECRICLFFSEDDGATWSEAVETSLFGICPDKLLELDSGRWILSCHHKDRESGNGIPRLWYSDDRGASWQGPAIVAEDDDLDLTEASILPVGDNLVAFLREESRRGLDCFKTVSSDGGETWGEVVPFPLPGCHRPISGWLNDGRILITYRMCQGRKGRGWWTQNFLAALTDRESALADTRRGARTRILPLDFDRSPCADTGYSGWVQFDDGEFYIVNYIVDDAPNGQIRGYSLGMSDFILEDPPCGQPQR